MFVVYEICTYSTIYTSPSTSFPSCRTQHPLPLKRYQTKPPNHPPTHQLSSKHETHPTMLSFFLSFFLSLIFCDPSSTLHGILDLLLLARARDDMREVAYGDTKRKIKRCEHDGEEDPPAGHGRDEGERAACLCTRGVR